MTSISRAEAALKKNYKFLHMLVKYEFGGEAWPQAFSAVIKPQKTLSSEKKISFADRGSRDYCQVCR